MKKHPYTNIEEKTFPALKATLLLENDWGLPIVRHVKLTHVGTRKKISGYGNQLVCKYVIKGERKRRGTRFDKVIVFEGWVDVEGAFNSTKGKGTDSISFDSANFDFLVQSVDAEVIADFS